METPARRFLCILSPSITHYSIRSRSRLTPPLAETALHQYGGTKNNFREFHIFKILQQNYGSISTFGPSSTLFNHSLKITPRQSRAVAHALFVKVTCPARVRPPSVYPAPDDIFNHYGHALQRVSNKEVFAYFEGTLPQTHELFKYTVNLHGNQCLHFFCSRYFERHPIS